MKKSNFEVIQELKVLVRQMDRLREGFQLEKEEAMAAPGDEHLLELRDRARSIYRVRLAALHREILMLRRFIVQDQPAREEAEDQWEKCRRQVLELDTHLVSTPGRLLRARREAPPGED